KRGRSERTPHVHHRQSDARRLCGSQPQEERIQVFLLAPLAADPDGTSALQIADDDAVLMTLADGDLVDADHARRRTPGARELLLHVALIEVLDRAVMKALQVTDCLDGHRATECADVPREAP